MITWFTMTAAMQDLECIITKMEHIRESRALYMIDSIPL